MKKSTYPRKCKLCRHVVTSKSDAEFHQMIKHKDKPIFEVAGITLPPEPRIKYRP